MTMSLSKPGSSALPLPNILSHRSLNASLKRIVPYSVTGRVRTVRGTTIVAEHFAVPIGAVAQIQSCNTSAFEAEVIGFDGPLTILAPLDAIDGVRPGDRIELMQSFRTVRASDQLIGRVLDATGNPIDDGPEIVDGAPVPVDAPPIVPLARPPIRKVLQTQIRAIDAMLTIGEGQRIGIFSGSGVGKSTLLGMLARGTPADVVVIGLIGERGREVREFLDHDLGDEGRAKSITVVATSDQPAPKRILAAKTATAIAEACRAEGKSVLLLMDSVTRFAMAQREIGLAAGEAPTTRGYPPSVFSMLPQLVERTGITSSGSITAFYTVLVEGDDPNEPISDALRGLLDGHIHLSRRLASRGHFPAIDILPSLSRLQHQLIDEEHRSRAQLLRKLLAIYAQHEELIDIGAYKPGSQPEIDTAIRMRSQIDSFLIQPRERMNAWQETMHQMHALSILATSSPENADHSPALDTRDE